MFNRKRKVFVPFSNERVFVLRSRPLDHYLQRDCRDWIEDLCGARWAGSGWSCDWEGWVFYFPDPAHALMFKLTWCGQ